LSPGKSRLAAFWVVIEGVSILFLTYKSLPRGEALEI
jgi:hypothetical protein